MVFRALISLNVGALISTNTIFVLILEAPILEVLQ